MHSISLFRVENTNFQFAGWGICCHSSLRKRRRSAIVLCSVILIWTAVPRTSHACSIQLRSGDIAGHSKRLTLLACRNPSTILARCGLALSSWKMPLLPTGRRKGTVRSHRCSVVRSVFLEQQRGRCDCSPSHLPRPWRFLIYTHGVAARWLLRDVPRFDARHVAARQCVKDKTGSHLRTWSFATVACSTWRDYEQTSGELLCASEKDRAS